MSMLHNGESQEEHDAPVKWGPTRTKTSFEPETNINNIIKRFTKTGQLEHISSALGEYRDLSGIPDLHQALTIVANAQSTFNELPAAVRKACDHDVGKFLPFIDNPANFEQCVEMGLLPPKSKTVPKDTELAEIPDPAGENNSAPQGGE